MLHRQNRQLQSHHPPDFARPQSTGIHDVLGMDVAVIGNDIPRAIRTRLQIDDPRVPNDLSATDLRRLRVGMSHAVGIDMSFDRIVHRTDEVLLLHQRKQLLRLAGRDELQVHAEVAAAGLGHLQPVHPLGRTGQHDAAGNVHAARLPGDLLELLVEVDRVLLQLGDVGIAVHGVHAARGMPGRARCQLVALDQQHVLPTRLGQVIQDTGAHDASADHHDSGSTLHRFTRLRRQGGLTTLPPEKEFRTARSTRSGTRQSPYHPALPGV